MELSTHLLDAEMLNRTLREKLTGLLNMVERCGACDEQDALWIDLLQNSISSHEYCEETLRRILNKPM